jgi:hypothetical protein
MVRPFGFGVVASLLVTAPSAFADNLISNPDFSQLINGWSRQSDTSGSIEADFSHGSPVPPSAHVFGDANNLSGAILSPCIAIDDSANIDFVFNALVVAGLGQGYVFAYTDTACTVGAGSIPTETVGPSGDWTTVSLTDAALPIGTRSVNVAMRANADSAGVPGEAYFDHAAFGPTGTLPEAIDIDQAGLTGAWYDAASSGQGFQFSIEPGATASDSGWLFGTWYTYDTVAGGTDTQRWYSLEASLADGAQSADVTIYQNSGGTFAAPPVTSAIAVGTGTLAFDSCMSGTFAYTFDDGRTGSIALTSLLPMVACAETGTPDMPPGAFGLSGAWYDPMTNGRGVLIDVDAFMGAVFVGWYTYAPDGASSGVAGQRWFTAQGNYGSGGPVPLTVFESTGGAFDTEGAATTVPVGTATLIFASCERATLDYVFTDGDLAGRSGTMDLSRPGATPASCELTP